MEVGDWQCQKRKDKTRSHENKDKEERHGDVFLPVQHLSLEV